MIAASGFVVGGGRTLRLGGARKARPLGRSSLRSRFDSSAAATDGGDDKDTLRGAVVGTSARGARHVVRVHVLAALTTGFLLSWGEATGSVVCATPSRGAARGTHLRAREPTVFLLSLIGQLSIIYSYETNC